MPEPYDYAYEDLLRGWPYYRRDLADREDSEGRGLAEHGEPAVFYLVRPISSGTSPAARTTYRCAVMELTNEEIEGADMQASDTGNTILATNIGPNRPAPGQGIYPCFKVGDRFVFVS